MITGLASGLGMILKPDLILLMLAGVAFGLILGALPGLQGSMGIALMLPFTYKMDALSALVLLLSTYTGGLFGGSITAILINTPGSPANLATILDGYPMTKKNQSNRAMGIALFCSVLGGLIGIVCLVTLMKPLAVVSLKFGPPEMFMIAVFGLTVVGSLSKHVFKSIFGGLFGILIGTIGINSIGTMRGTMGIVYLYDGVPLVPALIGFLALPEIFGMISKSQVTGDSAGDNSIHDIFMGFRDSIRHPFLMLRSAIIGVCIGIMPAAGASIATLVSYNISKQFSKDPDKFGTGIPEGVIASETANNASEGGSLATMLVLGIPGSTSTAMLIGAIMLQGWAPGPRLFIDHSAVIYASMSSMFLQQIVVLFLGIILCYYGRKVINLPTKYLIPCITMFTLVGAFSGRLVLFDVALMIFFGILAFFLKRLDFPLVSVVLGIILGPLADDYLLRTYQLYSDNMWMIFTRPITSALAFLSIASIFLPIIMDARRKRKASAA